MTHSILFDTDDNEWVYENSDTGMIDFGLVTDDELTESDREEIDVELAKLILSIQAQLQQRNADFDQYRAERHDSAEFRSTVAAFKGWKASAGTLKNHAVAAKHENQQRLKDMRRRHHATVAETSKPERLARSATGAMTSILAALIDDDCAEARSICEGWLGMYAERVLAEMVDGA